MLRKLLGTETWTFLILWLGLLWLGQTQFLFDPGSFWNSVIGQRIFATWTVPRVDEFSFTFAGAPWQSHQWLSQVAMAALHSLGGLDALLLGTASLLAATYTWAFVRLVRSGCPTIMGVFFLVLLLLGSRYHWLARPQLVTISLLGWTFARLADLEAGLISWRRLYWLPLVFVLWTNLHGGALGGLCTVGFVFAGWMVAWLVRWPNPLRDATDFGRLLGIGLGCVFATFVNPYGWELPIGWIRLMDLKVLPKYIFEHMPLDWHNPHQRGILLFGLAYFLVVATVPWRKWRVTWLVPILWFFLTLQRIRHCTLFSITAFVALADVLPQSRLFDPAQDSEALPPEPSRSKARIQSPASAWLVPAAVVSMALVLQAISLRVPLVGAGHARIDPALIPVDMLEAIRVRSKPSDPILNDIAYGGFLMFYVPELRVTIDDRCELYGDEFITNFAERSARFDRLRREGKEPAPDDSLDRWVDAKGIRLALVIKDGGLDYYLRNMPQSWTRVAETKGGFSPVALPGAVLFERK